MPSTKIVRADKPVRSPRRVDPPVSDPSPEMRHGYWSRSDILGVLQLVLAAAGLVVVALSALPALLPEVAVVTDVSQQDMRGLTTATTRFVNVSRNLPITRLVARWELDQPGVAVGIDHAAAVVRDSADAWKLLDAGGPLPPLAEFSTVFNSPRPFRILNFKVFAMTKRIDATGELETQVGHLNMNAYRRLRNERYALVGAVLAAFVAGYVLLIYLSRALDRR